jgi:hypothetical protein
MASFGSVHCTEVVLTCLISLPVNRFPEAAALKEDVAGLGIIILLHEIRKGFGILFRHNGEPFDKLVLADMVALSIGFVHHVKPSTFNERHLVAILGLLAGDAAHAVDGGTPVIGAAFNCITKQILDALFGNVGWNG